MYYANYNRGSWSESAVSFLDVSRPGRAYGRAWLIHRNQLPDIHAAEGRSSNWYPDEVELTPIDGIRAVTFTNRCGRKPVGVSKVSPAYLAVLMDGLHETDSQMSTLEIIEYLRACGER